MKAWIRWIIVLLLQAGCPAQSKDYKGHTPTDVARSVPGMISLWASVLRELDMFDQCAWKENDFRFLELDSKIEKVEVSHDESLSVRSSRSTSIDSETDEDKVSQDESFPFRHSRSNSIDSETDEDEVSHDESLSYRSSRSNPTDSAASHIQESDARHQADQIVAVGQHHLWI